MPLVILSKDTDLLGTDRYRDSDKAIPMAFRATIDMTVNPNSSNTNNQVTIKSVQPVVNTVEGVTTSKDSFLMVTKFSSLQHITNEAERERVFDNHLRFLIASKQSILDGQLPSTAVDIPTTGTVNIA